MRLNALKDAPLLAVKALETSIVPLKKQWRFFI
jgi:hypothetical protein